MFGPVIMRIFYFMTPKEQCLAIALIIEKRMSAMLHRGEFTPFSVKE